MNKEIIEQISNILTALGNIEVKGKNNLINLAASISMLEKVQHNCIAELTESTDNKE